MYYLSMCVDGSLYVAKLSIYIQWSSICCLLLYFVVSLAGSTSLLMENLILINSLIFQINFFISNISVVKLWKL